MHFFVEFISSMSHRNRDEMIGALDHDSALYGYTGPGTTWVN